MKALKILNFSLSQGKLSKKNWNIILNTTNTARVIPRARINSNITSYQWQLPIAKSLNGWDGWILWRPARRHIFIFNNTLRGRTLRCVVVMRCRRIQLVEGTGSISSTENTYGTAVNVTCNDGYKIAGETTLMVNCTATELWSLEPVSCDRKSPVQS